VDPTLKLRPMSDRFSDADNIRSETERDLRYSRLRSLANKRIIVSTSEEVGRGKVAYYDGETVAEARIFLHLLERGLDVGTIRKLGHAIRPPWEAEQYRHIAEVLPRIASGEAWVFEVTCSRDDLGEVIVSGYFRPELQQSSQIKYADDLAAFRSAQGHSRESTLIVYATDLIRPLLGE
jgi:hypothetical protein